jgi:hypothetical protein
MYDLDGSGILSIVECCEIIKDIYGHHYDASAHAKK